MYTGKFQPINYASVHALFKTRYNIDIDLAYVISCWDYFTSWHNNIQYIVAALDCGGYMLVIVWYSFFPFHHQSWNMLRASQASAAWQHSHAQAEEITTLLETYNSW